MSVSVVEPVGVAVVRFLSFLVVCCCIAAVSSFSLFFGVFLSNCGVCGAGRLLRLPCTF